MSKTKHKALTAAETKITGDKLDIHWEQFDLRQFRKGLKAELVDERDKAVTSCASINPKLLEQAVQAHFNQSSDHSTQRAQADKAAKHKDHGTRSVTQGEATANTK